MRSSSASVAAVVPFLLLTGLVTAACGGIPDPSESVPAGSAGTTGTTQQAIQGGTSAGTKYPFVMGMIVQEQQGFGICTATLIAPNLALTARHCVATPDSNNIDCNTTSFGTTFSASKIFVSTDTDMDVEGNGPSQSSILTVSKVIVPDTAKMCGQDIALLILDENVDDSVATPVTPRLYEKITDGTGIMNITAIGYGTTDGSAGAGTRRIRENIPVVCAYGHPKASLDCTKLGSADQLSQLLTESDLAVGTGVCEGDSGSSAFEQSAFDDGNFYSVGVLSRGSASDCSLGVYTRLDANVDLLVKAATEAASAGGYDLPDWAIDPAAAPKAELGGDCSADTDCKSAQCFDNGSKSVCSSACTDSCDDGFSCTDGHCLAAAISSSSSGSSGSSGSGGSETVEAKSGCSVAADPTKPIPWRNGGSTAALALGVALLLRRRSSR